MAARGRPRKVKLGRPKKLVVSKTYSTLMRMNKADLLKESRRIHRELGARAKALEAKGYNVETINDWKANKLKYSKKMTKKEIIATLGLERGVYFTKKTTVEGYEYERDYFNKQFFGDRTSSELGVMDKVFSKVDEAFPSFRFEYGSPLIDEFIKEETDAYLNTINKSIVDIDLDSMVDDLYNKVKARMEEWDLQNKPNVKPTANFSSMY